MIMKQRWQIFSSLATAVFAAWATVLPVVAAPGVPVATDSIVPRSIFNFPTNPKEGRDPFFPSSLRPYVSAVVKPAGGDVTSLRLAGISGTPGHRLVIINNHTFGAGDDGEVITSQGRMHVHCVEVSAKSVVLDADGQRIELHLESKP
jgi:hypothetical protein